MILTQGEKMVWAAAWTRMVFDDLRKNGPLSAHDRVNAMHAAALLVRELRGELPVDDPIWKPHEEDMQMLRAMLGDEG